ncbi:MAG TPA: hypothetical protein VFA18_07660, partial [Gemmataceae bacterium]|nr:hypothetical protein [Gemmataceae bacterium]
RLREVQLWSSTDQGKTWTPAGSVAPEAGFFSFTADRDGLFYFSVRTIDRDGRSYPSRMDTARPGLKVIVDTHPPVVDLHALPARDGQLSVAWDIRDDNLDLATITLEYRSGGGDWRSLHIDPAASGQHAWRPDSAGGVEARLRVRDRAGNLGERLIAVSGGTDGAVAGTTQPAPATSTTRSGVRMINSKRLNLNYEVREQGRSGVSTVELWYTTDSRSWQKREDKPYTPGSPLSIDVEGEGLYGFTIIPRSGVGLSQPPPQVGDQPQVWVEVDLTPPVVHLQDVQVGQGADSGKLTIFYSATDKHLTQQPIVLEYAESAAGPWKPIARDVDNTGRYVWQMPQDVPYQFLVRVKAVDQAGNVGSDQSTTPVKVDLAQPKGVILDVLPGK